jgi:hypothetical protein
MAVAGTVGIPIVAAIAALGVAVGSITVSRCCVAVGFWAKVPVGS